MLPEQHDLTFIPEEISPVNISFCRLAELHVLRQILEKKPQWKDVIIGDLPAKALEILAIPSQLIQTQNQQLYLALTENGQWRGRPFYYGDFATLYRSGRNIANNPMMNPSPDLIDLISSIDNFVKQREIIPVQEYLERIFFERLGIIQ